MIKISNLNKRFGGKNGFQVINNTSITLPDNGLITLLGESGSGKTTLLNVLGGLDKFDNGQIAYDTYVTNKYSMKDMDKFRNENISYIFQNYYLINNLSVYDNLRLALEIQGIFDKDEIEKRIKICLNAVKMWKYRKKSVDALSGGQQQRVAIARALIKDSKLIIADEPTGNLDSENSINIMNILKNISKNKLVLLVTHNKQLANYYSDYIYNIKDGTIVEGYIPTKGSLSQGDSAIYLGDLTKESGNVNDCDITIYNKDEASIKLELYCLNGVYHIKANRPIKLFDENKFKVYEGKKEEYKVEDEVVEYSTSEYNNTIDHNVCMRLFRAVGKAFKNFSTSRKRVKFFRAGLFVIGFIASLIAIFAIKSFHVDDSSLNFAQTEYCYDSTVVNQYYQDFNYPLTEDKRLIDAYKNGAISTVEADREGTITSISDEFIADGVTGKVRILKYAFNSDKIIYGNDQFASTTDIIISKKIADQIKLNLSYEKLIGKKVKLSSGSFDTVECTIIGITNGLGKIVYSSNHEFLKYDANNLAESETNLISLNQYEFGIYKDNESFEKIATLTSGRMPENKYEILMPNYYAYLIPSTYSCLNFTVVGTFEFNQDVITSYHRAYVSEETYKIVEDLYEIYSGYEQSIKVEDLEQLESLKLAKSYDKHFEVLKNTQYDNIKIYLIASGILIGVLVIYIYFTEHAKLISNIKEVGMLRAIGASKKQISGKYAAEAFVESICTVTIGYVVCGVGASIFEILLKLFTNSTAKPFYANIFYYLFLLCVIIIFTFFGSLPSIRLMRKTPSEIIAKYDI